MTDETTASDLYHLWPTRLETLVADAAAAGDDVRVMTTVCVLLTNFVTSPTRKHRRLSSQQTVSPL